jgi:uncharacterized protein
VPPVRVAAARHVSPLSFGFVSAAVLAAAFVQGTTGVGFALIVAPTLALVAPQLLPAGLLLLMVPLNVYVAWREWRAIDMRGVAWIGLGRFAGTFPGLWLLLAVSGRSMSILVGVVTIAAALGTAFLPPFRPLRSLQIVAGVVTGVAETATGIGGPPLALVYQHQDPAMFRATIASCFVIGEVISLAILAVAGHASMAQAPDALVLVPALAAGAYASRFSRERVNARVLRTIVLGFALASAAVLVVRS